MHRPRRIRPRPTHRLAARGALACAACLAGAGALADTGKLALTGGVSTIEGSAGGGLVPWALIGTQATEGQRGGSVFASRVSTRDYGLSVVGAAVAFDDRVEISFAHQDFDTGVTGTGLGLPGLRLRQDVVGVKLRLAGEAILDSDSVLPQIAVGLQHKHLRSSGLDSSLAAWGARREGVDLYLSASKLLLGPGILVNATLRATRANQGGLLGFGAKLGGARDGYQLRPEFSVAWLPRPNLAVGFEYRSMNDKLLRVGQAGGLGDGLRAGAWKDVFVAWAPNKHWSLTAAWVDLGTVVPATTGGRRQTGAYLSAQLSF